MRGSVRSVVAVAAASLIGAVVNAAPAGALTPPSKDPFYTPPPLLGSYAPGTILRSRPVTLFGLSNLASNTAYQLLYRTAGANGHPIATVTTLLEPALPSLGPRKLLSYQTAEDSLTTNCAPSYTMRGGNNGGSTQVAESGELSLGLLRGWDVVVPDYEGPRALAAADGSDANGCAGGVTNAPLGTVADFTNYPTPQALQAVPRVRKVFARLDLIKEPAPKAPSYFYNEILDEIAIIKPVDELFATDCAHGAVIDYYRDPLGEHLTGAATYVVPALNYLADRFDGKPAPNSCAR
jgi:hypothetical protein